MADTTQLQATIEAQVEEIVRLSSSNKALLELVKQFTWLRFVNAKYCRFCSADYPNHDDTCKISLILAGNGEG